MNMEKNSRNIKPHIDKLFNLKKWRGVAGLTQTDIADKISCKTACYCKKENGKIEFRRNEMFQILDAINERLTEKGEANVTLTDVFR